MIIYNASTVAIPYQTAKPVTMVQNASNAQQGTISPLTIPLASFAQKP